MTRIKEPASKPPHPSGYCGRQDCSRGEPHGHVEGKEASQKKRRLQANPPESLDGTIVIRDGKPIGVIRDLPEGKEASPTLHCEYPEGAAVYYSGHYAGTVRDGKLVDEHTHKCPVSAEKLREWANRNSTVPSLRDELLAAAESMEVKGND